VRERTPERYEQEEEGPIDFNGGFDDGDDDKGYDAPEVDFGGDGDVFMEEAESSPAKEEGATVEESAEEEKPAETTPQTTARPKLGRLAAAAKAKEEKEAAEMEAKRLQELRVKEADAKTPAKEKTVKFLDDVKLDSSGTSFRPDSIAAASTDVISGNNDLEVIVQKEANVEMAEASDNAEAMEPRRYLDIFWLDASERNGVVYLYGKVKVPNAGKETFQSCCVTIPNNLRNLFVLPRVKSESSEDQERHSITDVYGEIESVLRPSCIPRVQGASWSAKPVTRSYAFEDPSIPRGECHYLKVIYDAKYPVPEREVCTKGGKTFEKILGASAPTLENFLVKRRLMGPGWLRIYDPQAVKGNVSWCKWECTVEGPKSIKRLDLVTEGGEKVAFPPPPPVSTVSIKFKTVVNPKTQKLEIVCVSAICHSKVLLDSASDESTKHMTQLTLVRPLAGPENNGTMPTFPRDMEKEMKRMPGLSKSPNERALLSRLFAQIGNWDPDILVSHNGWGHDIDVLLNRCVELKVNMWSKIGRRVQLKLPPASQFGNGKDWAIANALDGRILCDTCISAKELLRETSYSLTNLTSTQLKEVRDEIEPVDIPLWCRNGQHFVDLANHTLKDAQLVQKLMFKLQILPLTKQLTNIAGNLWSRTMKGNRAERNEYLLLHEFHQLKYLVPEKRTAKQRKEDLGDDDNDTGNGKAKYSGGLVLDPKKGLYDSFILLLDFNSLYPSLIQEYNLCFTTMEWAKNTSSANAQENEQQGDQLPPLPDDSLERGVLPRVIKTLVERRRNVKKMIKSEKDADKLEEVSTCLFVLNRFINLLQAHSFIPISLQLDIRQKALKLTANSMYGCLGFTHSRFCAQPIAALVTAMGRETLKRTVDLAQTSIGLEVIYGDTDSIMINTGIQDPSEYGKVLELGNKVKREVNKLYKTLELEIDGVFSSMLLLKKKKYAAVTFSLGPDGKPIKGKETKGLDLVRRDWCIQSKESGSFVLDQILSGNEKDTVINNIHEHLESVAQKMRAGELPLEKYIITKGLNKHPNDYPDAKSLPHVFVAKKMLTDHRAVSIGDHIPYVITKEEQPAEPTAKKSLVSERACHPEDITRSNGALQPDVEWYLTQQILPPISRLCEPIEELTQSAIAGKLGLDSSKYNHTVNTNVDEDDLVDYTPQSCLSDEERFKDVEKLFITCSSCNETSEFSGVVRVTKSNGVNIFKSGMCCSNPECNANNWGEADMISCMSKVINKMNLLKKKQQKLYYDGLVRCDDPMCSLETSQLSVCEGCCLKQHCNGRMKTVYDEASLQTQIKYFDSLFDISHACKQHLKSDAFMTEKEFTRNVQDKEVFQVIHMLTTDLLKKNAYNWVNMQHFCQILSAVHKQ
jgi:DNA polymerase alpha subunit A